MTVRRSREASDGDSGQSIAETSHGLVWSGREEKTSRADEKVSRQDEVAQVMVTANVTIGSTTSEQQHEHSDETSKVAMLSWNTKRDLPLEGVVRAPSTDPSEDNVASSRSNSILPHDTKALLEGDSIDAEVSYQTAREATSACKDYRSEQLTVVETRNSVEKEGDTDAEQISDYAKDAHRFVMLIIHDVLAH